MTRMYVGRRRIAGWLVVLTCLSGAAPVWATINTPNSSVSPASVSVPVGRSTTVNVIWRIYTNDGGTVQSPLGEFKINANAPTLLAVNRLLSRPGTVPNQLVVFSEPVVIPADVIERARKSGSAGVQYLRSFVDADLAPVAFLVQFTITSSAGGEFTISRLALSFDDGSALRVVPVKTPLRVQAELSYAGSGLLQGSWEVAGPASTAGEPIFRPLRTLRQHLIAGDSQRLTGPDLPTEGSGFYLVRLRLTDPQPGFDPPTLRYFVGEAGVGGIPPRPLGLTSPPDGVLLAGDTRFGWQAVDGARAYQLEIYAGPDDPAPQLPSLGSETVDPRPTTANLREPPVTGMLVPAKHTQTDLSSAARQHLQPGRTYLWRVRALGRDGVIIGESPVREMRTP